MKKIIYTAAFCLVMFTLLSACGAETPVDMVSELENVADSPVSESEITEETDDYYEIGRAYLYGLDGKEINLQAAHENFEQARELGNVNANFYLGVLYCWYNYPEQNYIEAKTCFDACGDNPYAQIALAYLCGDTIQSEVMFQSVVDEGCVEGYLGLAELALAAKKYEMAFDYLNNATKGTEQLYIAKAVNGIGFMYQNGYGSEQDYAKALEWYEKAAALGNADAMNSIAYMYQYGLGAESDYAKALEWYEKAVALGNATAMNNIGFMYQYGLGVEQDYAKALEWYEKAAALGEVNAMDNIGYMYGNGVGVEQDYAEALKWYEKAATLGNATAMYIIGYMYGNGEGVEQDYAEELEWYEKAAAFGEVNAMNNIGYMYQYGLGVEQDYAKALEWYEKAAELGCATAMTHIGFMYGNGEGVEQDYAEALKWYEKAAALGHPTAADDAEKVREQLKKK